ncbi:uncharacterized protein LOC135074630 [Ostrinia nubilalis]|uniref:uncharacterized protein LOC135074630 n=1 Tax=Ostrinia nubilalis TaxID=29057 RepID=UPI0030823C8D
MWCTWATLLLVSSALVTADTGAGADAVEATTLAPAPASTEAADETTTTDHDSVAAESRAAVATTRAPPRTLDRQAAELAWRSWLQSAENGNQNAPPRRITTKSLFITPLVCPKGQRIDRNACVQTVTVDKSEHERILLEQLNALFSSPSSSDVVYDYGDSEPLQLSIPINQDPQAALLVNQEPSAQAQELQPNYANIDKKDENKDSSIEAELELLKLQQSDNITAISASAGINHDMNTLSHLADKPKRDSPVDDSAETRPTGNNDTDVGQKELVYGHVNVDPVLYNINNANQEALNINTEITSDLQTNHSAAALKMPNEKITDVVDTDIKKVTSNDTKELHNKEQTKLNPENDYSDIGEAIKLISRYAEVSTDDNFGKDKKKHAIKDDNILGTRTKLQYRRNKPKSEVLQESLPIDTVPDSSLEDKIPPNSFYPKSEAFYRYPWPSQHSATPPSDYPFRHLQDYWPGRNHIGGVYNSHGNPRRHHHSYPHYFRPHGFYPEVYPGQDVYPHQMQGYPHKLVQRHTKPVRSQMTNQGLYSLLGLRHWFSSEGTSKR